MKTEILAINMAGIPFDWLNVEDAIYHYARGNVAWEAGDTFFTRFGGVQRASMERSVINVNSIIALRGSSHFHGSLHMEVTGAKLYRRDRHMCAYCGNEYKPGELSMDHILPRAQGGPTSWMNLVTACRPCNFRKGNRTPEQARMPLLFVPYEPDIFERFILNGRHILVDQMDYLRAGLTRGSRFID